MERIINSSTSFRAIRALVGIVTLPLLILLVACHGGSHSAPAGMTDAQKVAEAKAALAIIFAPGDSVSGVTRNLGLPASGLHEVAVVWDSSAPDSIATTGAVFRPSANGGSVVVTLTATLTRGNASDTKCFSVVLLSTGSSIATVDGVQANGTPQKAGQAENAPFIGEAVTGTTAKSPTASAGIKHGFNPPIPANR